MPGAFIFVKRLSKHEKREKIKSLNLKDHTFSNGRCLICKEELFICFTKRGF